MQIQRIHITGFRSLYDVTIGGLGPVNIFYGENNAGKSNILAALDAIFRVERVEEQESPVAAFLRGELSNFVDNLTLKPNGEKSELIEMKIRLGLYEYDLKKMVMFSDFIKANNIYESGHVQRLELEVKISPTAATRATKVITKASINGKLMYDPSKPVLERFFPLLKNKVAQVVARQRPAEQVFLYLINSFGMVYADRFLPSEVIKEGLEQEIPLNQLKNWLLRLSESRGQDYDTLQEIQNLFNKKPFGYGKIRSIVQGDKADIVVRDESNREFLIDRLGTGVQKILLLLSNISNMKATMVGIEELELNLSPRLQSVTLSMLREIVSGEGSTIGQLIITSHSMHLGKREDTVLHAVSLNEDRGTIVERGIQAIRQLRGHFDYGLVKIPKRKWLR